MISKNKIKLIKSLAHKKFRIQEKLFLTEGDKNVLEVLNSSIRVRELIATETFLTLNKSFLSKAETVTIADSEEIKKVSLLKQPQNSLALCVIPPANKLPEQITGLCLYLDGIQDPGNMGTIIRTCDWFGMELLFCSPDTADVFNPKVIQASMGSFGRVKVVYTPFDDVADLTIGSGAKIFGAYPEGKNIYSLSHETNALVVLGNEGKGIRPDVKDKIGIKLSIPSFSQKSSGAESLNVAVAAAIICSEFKRKSVT